MTCHYSLPIIAPHLLLTEWRSVVFIRLYNILQIKEITDKEGEVNSRGIGYWFWVSSSAPKYLLCFVSSGRFRRAASVSCLSRRLGLVAVRISVVGVVETEFGLVLSFLVVLVALRSPQLVLSLFSSFLQSHRAISETPHKRGTRLWWAITCLVHSIRTRAPSNVCEPSSYMKALCKKLFPPVKCKRVVHISSGYHRNRLGTNGTSS